jgi:hypothetical protein
MQRLHPDQSCDPANLETIVTGYDLEEAMAVNRRRKAEAVLSQQLGELEAMLLPLMLSISRLTARNDAWQATQVVVEGLGEAA